VIVGVQEEGGADLLEIADAFEGVGFLADLGERGQEEADEAGDDGYDRE
jgi:hypothetical protein